jgi:hypothetical protein
MICSSFRSRCDSNFFSYYSSPGSIAEFRSIFRSSGGTEIER